jgi:acyl-CoA thioesterase I
MNTLPSPACNPRIATKLALAAMCALSTIGPCRAGTIAIADGQKLAFMGDSITAQGWQHPAGYVKLVVAGLEANGVKVAPVPAGIGGHKSNDMLARLDRDVIGKKPDWMTLSCGVNDVWHGAKGVPLDDYKKNITQIIDKAQAAGIKVMILTATMIGEDANNANNQKLAAYNDFLRSLAKEKKCLLADLNADMQAALKKIEKPEKPGKALTVDGVHMNPEGDKMMATGILKAFGLDDAQLKKAQDAWAGIGKK